jgi:pimeloyl-ACP methyl ester carboxylesterase
MEPLFAEFDLPPVIVGHSFGGRVAVALAAQHPESVSGLVLVGVPLLGRDGPKPRVPWKYRLIRGARRLGLIPEERLERAKKEFGSADYRAASGVMRDILVTSVNETYERELGKLACPVRLVWGERDSAAPVAIARAALPMIADGSLDVVPEAGHDVHLSHAGRVRAAIDGLLM